MRRWACPRGGIQALLLILAALRLAPAFAQDAPIVLPKGATIVAQGDSLTYGQDTGPTGQRDPINDAPERRSASPYPETLEADLGHEVRVENRGYPGDRTVDGLARWAGRPSGDLVILLYGTNDCANFGHRPGGPISLDAYRQNLRALIARNKGAGTKILLVTPPSLANLDLDRRLEFYRAAMRQVARETETPVVDGPEALKDVPHPWIEGVHLSPEGYQALARHIAARILVR